MKIILNLCYNGRILDAKLIRIHPNKKPPTPVRVDCTYLVHKILRKQKP